MSDTSQSRPQEAQEESTLSSNDADLSARPPASSSSADPAPAAPPGRMASFKSWRPLQMASKALLVAPHGAARRIRSKDGEALEEGGNGGQGEDEEEEEEDQAEGHLDGAVALDMEGSESTGGEDGSHRHRQHDKNKTLSMIDVIPGMISDEAEHGLEMLAHAVAADAREAEAEAAQAHAAATGEGEDIDSRQPLLRTSMIDAQRMSTGTGMLPDQQNITQEQGGMSATGRPRLPHPSPHVHGQGRKAGLAAKQQFVRTLTLPKAGETMEMELAVKDLLRYIQNAVRAVHVSQQQQQQQQSSRNINTSNASINNHPGLGDALQRELSAQQSFLRRGPRHSRAFSVGNINSAAMGLPAAGSRVLPAAPVGGLLNARDVRRLITGLDTESVKNKEMSIAVRRHTIVLNLDIIRCLILWDRLIVVIPEGTDSNCFQNLEENLRWLRVQQRAFDMDVDGSDDEEEEFEFLALEAVLMTVNNQFKNRLKDLRPHIIKNANALMGNGTLNTKHQDMLRQLKSKVANYQAKVRSLHKAIFDLLDDEEHLQMLHLTRIITQANHQQQQQLLNGSVVVGGGDNVGDLGDQQQFLLAEGDDNDEAEILLESFLGDFNELIIKWELVKEDMQNTENYVQVKLDCARNKLLTIGTIFSLISMVFGFGALLSGIFGMNLFNGVSEGSGSPESFSMFVGVVIFISIFIFTVGGGMLAYMYTSRLIVN